MSYEEMPEGYRNLVVLIEHLGAPKGVTTAMILMKEMAEALEDGQELFISEWGPYSDEEMNEDPSRFKMFHALKKWREWK